MVAASYSVADVVYTLLWVLAFAVEIWLVVTTCIDVFRSDDLSGWAKAGWVLLILALPILGVLAYLVARGDELRVHHTNKSGATAGPPDGQPSRSGAASNGKAAEIAHLAWLRDHGDITQEEFDRLKKQVIERESASS